MISWEHLLYFAVPTLLLAGLGSWYAYKVHFGRSILLFVLSILCFGLYIALMWHSLERPPMRTMGETRLWYSFFALLAGLMVYLRWHYRWILGFASLLAAIFIIINLFRPEIHNKSMMPALESPYFVPHVVSYMFSYAMLGAALLMVIYIVVYARKRNLPQAMQLMRSADNLVYTGVAFLLIGLLLGAIWAKQAWGHYWSWDPKETWAAITLLAYLIYMHFRLQTPQALTTALVVLVIAFLCLQICWYGVNYLPSAQGVSIHTYGS